MNELASTSLPSTLVLGGNVGKWNYKEKPEFEVVCNGVEAYVFAFQGDYCCWNSVEEKELQGYEIVFANLNQGKELEVHKKFLESRNFGAKWVIIIEGDAYDYLEADGNIRFVLNNADLVIVINKLTESYFQAQTTKECLYIGIPYPLKGIQQYEVPIAERLEHILLCSDANKRNTDYLAGAQMGLPLFCYTEAYSRNFRGIKRNFIDNGVFFDKHILKKKIQAFYTSPSITVEQTVSLQQIFQKISQKKLWVNLDTRYTWGRYVLDAASLGIPIVTSKSTGHASTLFPQTTLQNGFDISGAVAIGKKLLSDSVFYEEVSLYAKEQIRHYGLETIRSKILTLLGK